VNIPIPAVLANKIDEVMADSRMAYRTKTEFVIDCVREAIRKDEETRRAEK